MHEKSILILKVNNMGNKDLRPEEQQQKLREKER